MPCWCAGSIALTAHRCSTSSPIVASSRRSRRRKQAISRRTDRLAERRRQLLRVLLEHLGIFLAAGGRQQRDPVMARHDVDVQVKDDLSASALVELLNGEAV